MGRREMGEGEMEEEKRNEKNIRWGKEDRRMRREEVGEEEQSRKQR